MKKRNSFMSHLKPLVVIAGLLLIAGVSCRSPAQPEEPEEVKKTSNLKGTITGMFTNKTITQGEISLLTSWTTAPEHTTQIKNGEFQINNIEYPSNYTRIRIKSPEIINRETNIKLGTGENQAEIQVIEEDQTTGYHYEDYLLMVK